VVAVLRAPTRTAALPALRSALSTVTPEHYGRLGSACVPNLCRALEYADQSLHVEILEALEKIGDGRAVPTVRRLAQKGSPTAARILPALLARQLQENESKMLLRSASLSSATPKELLRPASETSTTEPQQLLRANISQT